jgi:hypothetical protein
VSADNTHSVRLPIFVVCIPGRGIEWPGTLQVFTDLTIARRFAHACNGWFYRCDHVNLEGQPDRMTDIVGVPPTAQGGPRP